MAQTQEKPAEKSKDKTRYYRSVVGGLQIQVGEPLPGEVAPQMVKFVTYRERWQGDDVNVGYLETDDERAFPILEADANVEEIGVDEYQQYTNREVNKNVKRLA